MASPFSARTTLTTLDASRRSAVVIRETAVTSGQRVSFQRVMSPSSSAGWMNGSSPCTLRKKSPGSRSMTLAMRAVPDGQAGSVISTSAPKPRATSATSSESVSRTTRSAWRT